MLHINQSHIIVNSLCNRNLFASRVTGNTLSTIALSSSTLPMLIVLQQVSACIYNVLIPVTETITSSKRHGFAVEHTVQKFKAGLNPRFRKFMFLHLSLVFDDNVLITYIRSTLVL